jgi:hypothetical protein
MGAYLSGLIDTKRCHPGSGILGTLARETGPGGSMSTAELVATAVLLLVADHETTVNLISNATLTLLRHPDILQRFRNDPDLTVPLVEEVLRHEPPVQFIPFTTALADIDTTIPRGAPVWLLLASANRDPKRFEDPDRFDPSRKDNEHLGFYTGIHYCFGAPPSGQVEAALELVAVRAHPLPGIAPVAARRRRLVDKRGEPLDSEQVRDQQLASLKRRQRLPDRHAQGSARPVGSAEASSRCGRPCR